MNEKIPASYVAKNYENNIYAKWEKSGKFNPDNLLLRDNAPTYTIVLPPPNITDKLHLGHAAMIAIEDLLIRFHRMRGYRTLWIPGTDHAAIATQNVVEKRILKEEGKTRHDLGRTVFLDKVWDFVKITQATILDQIRKMGASLDWSREAFTLDEKRQKAVSKMFIDMYAEGIIYRGERIVNWCPRCQSTLADDEVEYKTQTAKLYTFKYDHDFPIAISTTRPETKLGDTAIAVNPKDARYAGLIGKTISTKFCGIPLKITIIADHQVDPAFGTGALGVTPAHSHIDWKIAEKNNLKIIKVIDEQGKIHPGFGEFSGLSAEEARKKIVSELKEKNLLSREEEIENNLSTCYRCSTPIEPLPSKQWFVAVDKKLPRLGDKSLKEKAIEAAINKKIEFIPERFTKRYTDWIENLHDWCISRQIWFGHRIPVWYKKQDSKNDDDLIYVGETPPQGDGWIQDEDSLDTWFSSGMWTFSTLGWPDNYTAGKKIGDLAKFHPTQIIETGYEILTLWVSRMIIMSFFSLGEIPFEKVYLHGMVQDQYGKKMSKSKGNGINPLDMIEKYGTDAVRLSLLVGSTPGNDIKFYEEKISGMRNFINKIWNISRYILLLEESGTKKIISAELKESDYWILKRMMDLINKTTENISHYNFSQAGEDIYAFAWNDLADWYIEACKFEKTPNKILLLRTILSDLLKLLHPFAPFITEKIWENISDTMLMTEKWPDTNFYAVYLSENKHKNFEIVKDVIISIRNLRSEYKIEPQKKIKVVIYTQEFSGHIALQAELIKKLKTGIDDIRVTATGEKITNALYTTAYAGKIEIYLMDTLDKDKKMQRINKELSKLSALLSSLKNKLNNQEFIDKAPQQIIVLEQERKIKIEEEIKKFQTQLDSFK
jgi:valyl-tRNA synthetase